MDDRDLFAYLGQSEFDAIITLDSRQLEDPEERAALIMHGLHWIGVPPIKARGQMFLALLTGTVTAGLPHVFEHWQDTPHAYHLRAIGEARSFQPSYHPLSG
ncbi:hypothetical protein [Plantactinospora sp. KBS50]|uniref:hypothetical protein n=1 Tax=Plantactinospora sp. KBS50 TaxID=2024580 RepID=UPI000BAB0925|nr:hypothetical protein [Plantactinospora sp. KBS50]ASW57253.1 hypothetical protein CIK06_28600 [Plantactinospora sp. KBS50]